MSAQTMRKNMPRLLLLLPTLSLTLLLGPGISLSAGGLTDTEQNPKTTATVQASLLNENPYILGAGDRLEIRLFDAPELSGEVSVLNDGTASLPLIGSVRVQGLTLVQAELWFTALYRQQLQRPDLQVSVVQPRPIRVAMVGEVERPGLYSLTTSESSQTEGAGNKISGLPTVVDALQKAGGITLYANLRKVVLQRRLPGDDPAYKRTNLNLLALLQEGDQLQNPLLFDGDTIRVIKADQPVEESIEVASANFSPQVINVNITGEVEQPGLVNLQANTPLVQGVLAAGGPQTWRANTGNVELIRINRNGSATRQRFRLDLSQGASNEKNPPLRDGDTIVVHRSGLAKTSDAIGAVSEPISGLVNLWALLDLINKY